MKTKINNQVAKEVLANWQAEQTYHRQQFEVACRDHKIHCPVCGQDLPTEAFYRMELPAFTNFKKMKIQKAHSRSCKECTKKLSSEYKRGNRDKVKKYQAEYYAKNESKREYNKQYQQLNPNKMAASAQKRAQAEKNATPAWLTPDQRKSMKLLKLAAKLMSNGGVQYVVDHIIPLQGTHVCGLHTPWNMRILTAADNAKKFNLVVTEKIEFNNINNLENLKSKNSKK